MKIYALTIVTTAYGKQQEASSNSNFSVIGFITEGE